MIPKIIHQVWLQGAEHFQENRKNEYAQSLSIQKFFPDWEYHLWNQEEIKELIDKDYPKLTPLFINAPNLSYLSDLGRFALLHKYGGMYMDTDYIILKSFEHLLPPNVQFAAVYYDAFTRFDLFTVSNWLHNTCFIASQAGHGILDEIMTEMINYGPYKKGDNVFAYNDNATLKSYNRVLQKHMNEPDVLMISNYDLEPLHSFNQNKTCSTAEECQKLFPAAYAVHTGVGSWIPGIQSLKALGKVYGQMRDGWQIIAIVLICISILFIILFAVTFHKFMKYKKTMKNCKCAEPISPIHPKK